MLVAMYSSSFSMRFWFSSISRSFCLILAWIKGDKKGLRGQPEP